MKDWLLKEEIKNKVGRPRLATDKVVKKAIISIVFCVLICFVMISCFVCSIKNVSFIDYAYNLTLKKLPANLVKSNTFSVNSYYDDNNNYVMNLKPSNKVKSYSGKYRYVLYKLVGSDWKKQEEKTFEKNTKNISINVESLKNKNQTYKINLYIINAAKINDNFAPFSWTFVDSKDQNKKFASTIFTVKGYYSPISINEIKESKNKTDKITVETSKNNPRLFTIKTPQLMYDLSITYTDENGKTILLAYDKNVNNSSSYLIPDVNKLTNVTIKILTDNVSKYKLSNWKLKKDKDGKEYITNSYNLKPYNNYK